MTYADIPDERIPGLVESARRLPTARADVSFPDWYFKQWHFYRDGYLSPAAVARYKRLIRPLYTSGRPVALDRLVAQEVFRRAPVSIIELGCGPGTLLSALADGLPEARVVGVDLSPYMLKRAAEDAGSAPNVHLEHRDASLEGAIPPGTELVLAVHLLGHIPRKVAAGVMFRVAETLPGNGAMITVDHRWHRPPPLPRDLTVWRRRRILGGWMTLREYRRRLGSIKDTDPVE